MVPEQEDIFLEKQFYLLCNTLYTHTEPNLKEIPKHKGRNKMINTAPMQETA
jgi:hypothetical protein